MLSSAVRFFVSSEESYIWFLQSNVIRTTGMDCPLPDGDTETQAQAMFRHLDRIGGLRLLGD